MSQPEFIVHPLKWQDPLKCSACGHQLRLVCVGHREGNEQRLVCQTPGCIHEGVELEAANATEVHEAARAYIELLETHAELLETRLSQIEAIARANCSGTAMAQIRALTGSVKFRRGDPCEHFTQSPWGAWCATCYWTQHAHEVAARMRSGQPAEERNEA